MENVSTERMPLSRQTMASMRSVLGGSSGSPLCLLYVHPEPKPNMSAMSDTSAPTMRVHLCHTLHLGAATLAALALGTAGPLATDPLVAAVPL